MARALWVEIGVSMAAILLYNMKKIHFIDEHWQSPYIYSARPVFKCSLRYLRLLKVQFSKSSQKRFKAHSALIWMSKMVFGGISVVLWRRTDFYLFTPDRQLSQVTKAGFFLIIFYYYYYFHLFNFIIFSLRGGGRGGRKDWSGFSVGISVGWK